MAHHSITVHLPAEHNLYVSATEFAAVTVRHLGATDSEHIMPGRSLRLGPFSAPRDYRIYSSMREFNYVVVEEKLAYNHEGTGLFEGGTISINATDATKIDIAAGTGIVVDNYTNPEVPNVIHITWPNMTAIDVEFLATEFGSFIGIDATGTVQQFPASNPNIDKRDNIFLGLLGHSNQTTVTSVASAPIPGYDQTHMIVDLVDSLGLVNKSGNVYGPNGANLKVDKTVGESFALGYNYTSSTKEPNITTDPATTATTLFPGYRDGSGGFTVDAPITDVPVAFYDNGTGTLAAIPASDPWSVFRIYHSPAINNHVIIYGQNVYKNKAEAEAALFGEVHETAPELANTVLRAYLIVKRDTTDLSDTAKAKFIQANKFGGSPASGISTSTTTLQQAYANSAEPEIITNSAQQAFTVQEGTGTAANTVIEVLNNATDLVFSINGLGQISAALISGSTANRPANPIDYMMFFDTTLGIPIYYNGSGWVDASGVSV